MISYTNNDFNMYTYDPNGNYGSNYNTMNNGIYNGFNYNQGIYNTMRNNNINSSVPNYYCTANTYGYCPYTQNNNGPQHNIVENHFRGNCPYDNENYQYSPTVNCINPYYPSESSYRTYENSQYNGDMKIRFVSIEDIRD